MDFPHECAGIGRSVSVGNFNRLFLLALLAGFGSGAFALERSTETRNLLSSKPHKVIRLEEKPTGRFPASVASRKEKQRIQAAELDEKLRVGTYAIVRNSVMDWNDQVVRISARYEDGARQILLDDGRLARVSFENLVTLSPETERCCKSNGAEICKGEKVYHPLASVSLGTPEGKVEKIFENCSMVVRDGLDYVYRSSQLAKAVDCSPQKDSVCVGKIVYVEGYKDGKRYEFEGPVELVLTNGLVLVKNGLWLMPTEAAAATVQTESLFGVTEQNKAGMVVTSRDGQRKLFVPTQQELEPYFDSRRFVPTVRSPASVVPPKGQ